MVIDYISGDFLKPKQLLHDQKYDGHKSLHDEDMAEGLGFSGAPIEGCTHLSQFVPLLKKIFKDEWFISGCISVHYKNMVFEGERVKAFVKLPKKDSKITDIWMEKEDGTYVLSGTAGIGPKHETSALDSLMSKLDKPEKLVILSDIKEGLKSNKRVKVKMGFDQHMGDLYPFTLNEKLAVITELDEWYTEENGNKSPWRKPIIPIEMISVLTNFSGNPSNFSVKGPVIGLFANQEIKLFNGPLFVDEEYQIEKEIIALSQSKRVETYWCMTSVYDKENILVAECLLNQAFLKDSYKNYEQELKDISG